MANERKVDLVVRGKDQFSPTFDKLTKAQQRLLKQQQEIAASGPKNLRNFYQQTQQTIDQTQASISRLANEFKALSVAEGDNRAAIAALVIQKAKLQVKAGELRASLQGVREASHALRTTQESGFKAFNQTATAMEREADATRALAAARQQANARLGSMINDRLNNPVRSNFNSFSSGAESRVAARQEAEMSAIVEQAYTRREAEMRRMADIQQRLNTQVRSGFGDWSRYADQITRIAREEDRAAATASRKEAIRARLNSQVQSGYAAFIRSAEGITREAQAAQNNATILNKLATESRKAAQGQDQLAASTAKANTALARQPDIQRRSLREQAGFRNRERNVVALGLEPYQLTNLGYQVNDVVSGLAMGQAPMQVFAQQIGQVIQIWPELMVALTRGIPVIAGVAAVLAGPIAAMARISSEASTLKGINQQLALSGDAGAYDAEKLAAITNGMREYGIATSDARAITADFIKNGLPTADLERFARTAQNMSRVLGVGVTDAAKQLSEAFSGGVDEVIELDRELNVLTASQLENILAMADAGDEAGALESAYDAIEKRYDEVAAKATGPWSQAWRNLGTAWRNFVSWLADTMPIQVATAAINQLGDAVAYLTGLLADFSAGTPGQTSTGMEGADVQTALAGDPRLQRELEANNQALIDARQQNNEKLIAQLQDERQQIEAALAKPLDLLPPSVPAAEIEELPPVVTPETQREEKDRLLNQRELNQTLDEQTAKLAEQARLAGLSTREQFVQNQLADAARAAKEAGLELSDAQLASLTAQAGATFDALENEKERTKAAKDGLTVREQHEKNVNDLLDYRKALMEQIEILTETGNTEEADKLKEVLQEVNAQTVAAIDGAIKYLSTLSGPEIQAAIANLQALRLEVQRTVDDLGSKYLPTAEELNEELSEMGADAFGNFSKAVAQGENAFDAFFLTVQQGLADFLVAIGKAIVQQALLNALTGGGGAGGGAGGFLSGAIGSVFHQGGVIGRSAAPKRMVNPAIFQGAQRFHTGGVIGLGPNEVPIIGMKDEEVLTRDDPRHVMNGGKDGGAVNVKNVNVFDPADVVEAALQTVPGEKVMLNWLTRNASKVNGALS